MSADLRIRSARRHLDLFEESWKADHDAAMRCRDFEAFLAVGVMVFRLIDGLHGSRRERVFRGLEEPNHQFDAAEKECYLRWLALADSMAPHIPTFAQKFGTVESAEDLQTCQAKARFTLSTWAPAALAGAVGSRALDFSVEDAEQVRAALQTPGGPGRPTRPPRRVPTADPSVLG